MGKNEKWKCCNCGKKFPTEKVLTTGFNDEKGEPEVVCLKCDKQRTNQLTEI